MGTSNFSTENATKTFAVLMDYEVKFTECNECGEKQYEYEGHYIEENMPCRCGETSNITRDSETKSPEAFEYDDFKENLIEVARRRGEEAFTYLNQDAMSGDAIFRLDAAKTFSGMDVDVRVNAIIRSGYYEGANLDWEIEYTIGNHSYDSPDVDIMDVEYYCEDKNRKPISKGLAAILRPKIEKWLGVEGDKLTKLMEEIFTEVSMPLEVVARFSNGETMYAKA